MKYILFVSFLFSIFFSNAVFAHPIDLKYIPPEKRYEMEKQIYERKMSKNGFGIYYAPFPDFFIWQQIEMGREAKFYEWIKTFLLFLDGAISCEMSYYIWADQNPVKVR